MRFPRRAAALLLAAAALALPRTLGAQIDLPAPRGYVNDFANVIGPAYQDSLQAVIDDVRGKSGGEIVVVTLPSLQGRDRDEVALQIGREWGVGKKGGPTDAGRNTGVIVLVSMQDRKWKIETGTGTMTFIPAAEAGRIGRDLMVPALQAGNPGAGILHAVQAIAQAYATQYRFTLSPAYPTGGTYPQQPQRSPYDDGRGAGGGESDSAGLIIFIVFIVLIVVMNSMGRRRSGCGGCIPIFLPIGGRGGGWGGGGWGGGGGGGGFGGFGGGGGFSGGGSGGDW